MGYGMWAMAVKSLLSTTQAPEDTVTVRFAIRIPAAGSATRHEEGQAVTAIPTATQGRRHLLA
jgi:hypothetical protein